MGHSQRHPSTARKPKGFYYQLRFIMHQPISSLNLSNETNQLKNKLNRLNLKYVKDIVDNGISETDEVRKSRIVPPTKTFHELYLEEVSEQKVSTSINDLDCALNGGLRPGQITEFCGETGTGKTQLCFEITAKHLLANKLDEAVFISTNNNFSTHRIKEIIIKLNSTHSANIEETENDILRRIYVFEVTEVVELLATVKYLQAWLLSKKVSILIIDSIFMPIKPIEYSDRKKILYRLLSDLQILGNKHKFPIVLTNNITTRGQVDTEIYHPAYLGENYYHRINARIQLRKLNLSFQATILKSVCSRNLNIPFNVI